MSTNDHRSKSTRLGSTISNKRLLEWKGVRRKAESGRYKGEVAKYQKDTKKVDSGEELSASTSERTDTLPNHVFWGLSRANTPGLTHKINSMRYVTDPGCYVHKASVRGPNLKLIHPTRLIPVLNLLFFMTNILISRGQYLLQWHPWDFGQTLIGCSVKVLHDVKSPVQFHAPIGVIYWT